MGRLLTLGLCVALLLFGFTPVPDASAADAEERLDDIQQQIDDLTGQISAARAERGSVAAELEAARANVTQVLGELAAAESAVAEVELSITKEEARLADLQHQIAVLTDEIAATRQSLVQSREHLEAQAVALYMSAASGMGATFMGFESTADAAIGMTYSGDVIDATEAAIGRFTALRNEEERQQADIDARADEVEVVLVELAAEKERRDAELAKVEELRAQAEADVAAAQRLLARITADIAAFEDHMAGLEAESARIEAEIRAAQDSGGTNPGALGWPVAGRVTSPFGYRTHPILGTRRLHAGIDIGAASGSPISAAESGRVILAGPNGGYGNAVVIDHGGGLSTLYAHQSSIAVSAGQQVQRGDLVGYVGCTGLCTGAHLHFETRENAVPVDPMKYLG